MALPFPSFPDGKIAPPDKCLGRVGTGEDNPLPRRDLHQTGPDVIASLLRKVSGPAGRTRRLVLDAFIA
jgi:hypothetical protein